MQVAQDGIDFLAALPRGLGGGSPAAYLPHRFLAKVQNWSEFGQTYEN
jgi:hypothetical protein